MTAETVTDCDDVRTLGWHRWRFGSVQYHVQGMSDPLDPDLIAYLHWAKDLRGLADNTLRTRLELLQRLARWLPVSLREATPQHILDFERVAIAGRAAQTRRAYACHIRALYRWMLASEIIDTDPTRGLTLPMIGKHLPRPIDDEDLAVAVATARTPKLRAMIVLGGWAGLRCCETAALEWGDLRRETHGDRGYLHIRGKGDKDRTVEIGRTVIGALQGYGIQRRGPMFLGYDGAQITANAVSRTINRHLRQLGFDATAHQLRHRYGTTAYQLSKDSRMVQEQMGHASADTTAIYTRPSAEAAARMVAAMDAMNAPAPPPSSARADDEIPDNERKAS